MSDGWTHRDTLEKGFPHYGIPSDVIVCVAMENDAMNRSSQRFDCAD